MNDFKVTEVIDSNTIRVEPFWEMEYNGHLYSGDRINVRGLEGLKEIPAVKERLKKILIGTKLELSIDSPELINYSNTKDSIVSCSVYLGQDNVFYYFSEFVSKY